MRKILHRSLVWVCFSAFLFTKAAASSDWTEVYYSEVYNSWYDTFCDKQINCDLVEVTDKYLDSIANHTLAQDYFSLLINDINKLAAEVSDTKNLYHSPTEGDYQRDRKVLHCEIIETLLSQFSERENRHDKKLWICLGGSGNGKSTVISEFLPKIPHCPKNHISSDIAKTHLPEYRLAMTQGYEEAAPFVHRESSDLNKLLIQEAISRGFSFIYESTGSSTAFSDWLVDAARNEGYEIFMVIVDLTPENSLKRVLAREKITRHKVPQDFVAKSNKQARSVFLRQMPKCDRWMLLDNHDTIPRVVWSKDESDIPLCMDTAYLYHFLRSEDQIELLAPTVVTGL